MLTKLPIECTVRDQEGPAWLLEKTNTKEDWGQSLKDTSEYIREKTFNEATVTKEVNCAKLDIVWIGITGFGIQVILVELHPSK